MYAVAWRFRFVQSVDDSRMYPRIFPQGDVLPGPVNEHSGIAAVVLSSYHASALYRLRESFWWQLRYPVRVTRGACAAPGLRLGAHLVVPQRRGDGTKLTVKQGGWWC